MKYTKSKLETINVYFIFLNDKKNYKIVLLSSKGQVNVSAIFSIQLHFMGYLLYMLLRHETLLPIRKYYW